MFDVGIKLPDGGLLQDELIVDGAASGGAHTSRTMMLGDLTALLESVPADAAIGDYERAIKGDNVLGKGSGSSRSRSFRYLRELYSLDPNNLLFRALRDLWEVDVSGRRLLALLTALARDPGLRATSESVLRAAKGEVVTSADLQDAVQKQFNYAYSDSVANKIGRNAASSWTQSGHLEGHSKKVRKPATATPGSTAFALMLGHVSDARGSGLFETPWAHVLDVGPFELQNLAVAAGQRGWLEYRRAGDVIDIGFRWLLREWQSS